MWTERERRKAEAGEVVQDLDDLRNKVCELKLVVEIVPTDMHAQLDKRYVDGCSKDTDGYLRVSMDVLRG